MKRLQQLMDNYPAYTRLWHRATGQCGVVIGWVVDADAAVSLRMDYGPGGCVVELPGVMAATKLAEDGEDWKIPPDEAAPGQSGASH